MSFIWLKFIALAYRAGEIDRARFVQEWRNAQETLKITPARRPV
jgi:hypothetical protein